MPRPLVSIVTPCFNSTDFIECCIESVLAQSYPHVEHIVQDGASEDGTVDVLRRYTGKIDWVSEPDDGQSDGLDRAIKRSRGDILLVLNADDMLLPHAAEWAVEKMQMHLDAAVIYGDVYFINEWGKTFGEFIAPDYDLPGVLCVEKVIPAQAAFMRRTALEAVGLGADKSLDTCPDYEMFVRLGLKFPMVHELGFVTKYRQYRRAMDGASPRTVERFVAAKALVMERVFRDPDVPAKIKRLRKRAYTGLHLWASQEARAVGQLSLAWAYYAKALQGYPIWGPVMSSCIRVALAAYRLNLNRSQTRQAARVAPSTSYLLRVGAGLWRDSIGNRTRRTLSLLWRYIVWLGRIIVIAVLLGIFLYLIYFAFLLVRR
jgi:glycosyltransferase involved in cell wall biosynthesis